MKRIITFVLIILMILVPVGCNNNSSDTTINVVWDSNGGVGTQITDWVGKAYDFSEADIPDGTDLSKDEFSFIGWSNIDNASEALSEDSIVSAVKNESVRKFFAVWVIEVEHQDYVYEGTETKAPFRIFNPDGTLVIGTVKTVHSGVEWETDGYEDNIFRAIHIAGANSLSTHAMYVLDDNDLEVYRRRGTNTYYMYDGTNYVGFDSAANAMAWGKNRSRCYLVTGTGSAYAFLGAEYMPGSEMSSSDRGHELNAGAYNYMFSKSGSIIPTGGMNPGYGYMSVYIRLSEARYLPFPDNEYGKEEWNAYILLNGQTELINPENGAKSSEIKDFGFIGNEYDRVNKKARWRFCGDALSAHPNYVASEMEYDSETGDYKGGDDLFCELMATPNGWRLSVMNLATGINYSILQPYTSNWVLGSSGYLRMMLGVSYCPTVDGVWDARRGPYIKNMVFDGIKVARYNPNFSSLEDYRQSDSLEDFYPNEPSMNYGFAQGGDAASFEFGKRTASGAYLSGNTYSAGDKYLVMSTFYDGIRV